MKVRALLRHLKAHGCEIKRDTGKHTMWWNPANDLQASVPRHVEIATFTGRGICLALGVPEIKDK